MTLIKVGSAFIIGGAIGYLLFKAFDATLIALANSLDF